jgi:hypothetical protein
VCRSALVIFTFLFAVTWQFNQFALLLQAMALFGLQALNLVEHRKVNNLSALCLLIWRLQYLVAGSWPAHGKFEFGLSI